jgi:hypothetical protein
MIISAHVEQQILLCNMDLTELVTVKGYVLTHPEVVNKSKELDQYILCAMRSQSSNIRHNEAS